MSANTFRLAPIRTYPAPATDTHRNERNQGHPFGHGSLGQSLRLHPCTDGVAFMPRYDRDLLLVSLLRCFMRHQSLLCAWSCEPPSWRP